MVWILVTHVPSILLPRPAPPEVRLESLAPLMPTLRLFLGSISVRLGEQAPCSSVAPQRYNITMLNMGLWELYLWSSAPLAEAMCTALN